MTETLASTIAEYQALHGEPEYRYSKKRVSWCKDRRKPGYHCVPIGDGEEVTKDEYEANVAESKHHETEAFMGRYPQSYWRFDRKLSRDGWREVLLRDVENAMPDKRGATG